MLKILDFVLGILLLSSNNFDYSYGDVELCTESGHDVFVFQGLHCPGGVLFNEPVDGKCLRASSSLDRTDWKEDVCGGVDFTEKKVQLMTLLDDEAIPKDEGCVGEGDEKCNYPRMIVSEMQLKPQIANSAEEYVPTPEESELSNDTAVVDQTERLLKYMHGLLEDPEEYGPILRIVDLLKMSFDITTGYCYAPYVSTDFTQEIMKGFLFILRESDTNRIKDVTIEEYDRIMLALAACKEERTNPDMAFEIQGTECITEPKINTVKVGSQKKIKFQRGDKDFKLNKYDLVIDATWSIVDFIHGNCFYKFSPHFNSHHLYQQAMERLITEELIYRWTRPTLLSTTDAWDAVFLGNVRTNMRNIDACIQGAYQGKPYLHRLERMLDKHPTHRRRRRSLGDANELDGAGWCFQTDAERESILSTFCNGTAPGER